ncbi:type II toxin-antitoxin system HicA family toxin [Adlercreutzia sp. ZJ473]|uniref:type II toxin-antitoxin system HicA family toxin n=1 Tax=Adlercreutzia sp. ZJ473 TaxID=2722822 RepID=UPI003530049C
MKFFKSQGFIVKGGTNHDKLVHPDGRWTTLGRHTEIDDDTFRLMKKQAGLK